MKRTHRPSSGLSIQGLLTALFILALLAVLILLLTERNQRRYFLRTQGSLVIVDRGLPLPYGHGPYRPGDPGLQRAYQAFRLPGDVVPPGEESFDDRFELDQRLGDLLIQSAKSRLGANDDGHLEDGMAFLNQVDALPELSADQRRNARKLRAEVAYAQASDEVARALTALHEATDLLKLGTQSPNGHAKESADLLDRISPLIDQLQRAARGGGILPAERSDLPAAAPAGDAGVEQPK